MACGQKTYKEGSRDNVIIKILQFLTSKGFTFLQACAVCGNIFQESGGYEVDAVNPNSQAIGLCQWLGQRKNNLIKAAQKQGKQWTDINVQLDFLWEELNGPENNTLRWFKNHRYETIDTFTQQWTILFERCGVSERCFNIRIPEAKRCAEKYTNFADGIVGSGSSDSNTTAISATNINCLDLSHANVQEGQGGGTSQSASTTGFSGTVTNPKMKMVLSKLDYFYNYGETKGDCKAGTYCRIKEHNYLSKCTYGPTTFYKNAGIELYFWCGQTGNCNGKSGYPIFPTFNCIKKRMDKYGFYLAGHWDFDEARNNPNSIYRPGDVATLACSPCGAHALMWTGFDWRSDAIEKNICSAYPNQYKGKFGNYSVCIWRRADCQEPGLDTTPVPCTIC